MAMRFTIGLYALVALAVLVLAACGGGDGGGATDTPAPSVTTSPTLSPATVADAPCSGDLYIGLGPVAIVGRVVEASPPDSGTEPGFDNMIVTVRIDDSGFAFRPMFVIGHTDVVLLGDLITEVDVGDCVTLAGQEQRWACGPDCDAVGFVASFFEVIEPD